MTEENFRIVTFIDAYTRAHGHPPTYAEIATAVGFSSVGHVQYRIGRLEAAGYLARTPRRARSLRVVRMPPGTKRAAAGAPLARAVAWIAKRIAALGGLTCLVGRRVGDDLGRVWLWLRDLWTAAMQRRATA